MVIGIFKYSTYLSRVWLLLYMYRVLVYFAVAQYVWIDKNRDFECNTIIQSCTSICYDHHFSISPSLLWDLQLIFIIFPSLLVSGHVKWREHKNLKYTTCHKGQHLYANPEKKRGGLWWTYQLSLVLKAGFDMTFLFILKNIYKGYDMPKVIRCDLAPCPRRAYCFVSRPTEKKIFTIFMVVSACVCVVMCICEMVYLICKRIQTMLVMYKHRVMFAEIHELSEFATPRTSRYKQPDPTASRPPSRSPSRTPSRTSVNDLHNPTTSPTFRKRLAYV